MTNPDNNILNDLRDICNNNSAKLIALLKTPKAHEIVDNGMGSSSIPKIQTYKEKS